MQFTKAALSNITEIAKIAERLNVHSKQYIFNYYETQFKTNAALIDLKDDLDYWKSFEKQIKTPK